LPRLVAALAMQAYLHVPQHRGEFEQARSLKRAHDAKTGYAMRLQSIEELPAITHAAVRGPKKAADGVERRRLARSVGSDQAYELAFMNIERQCRDGLHASEADREVVNLKNGCTGCHVAVQSDRVFPGTQGRKRRENAAKHSQPILHRRHNAVGKYVKNCD